MASIPLVSPAFVLALICAALMGYAIQRGATCMVLAVEEVVAERRFNRLAAMLEAGLWVAGGLIAARLFGHLPMTPVNYAIAPATVLGGAVLGLGALINRSCVFGSIAKLGSGKWAYLFTPAGFFLGCLLADPLVQPPLKTATSSPLFGAVSAFVLPLAIYALWRGRGAIRALRQGQLAEHIWAPHQATMLIGLAFVLMMLTVGNWAYTQLLAELALGEASDLAVKLTLFAGLLGGAIVGGWSAGLIKPTVPASRDVARCLIGGMLMGMGSLMIPGSNDGLILIGLPLILPYAWISLASMIVAIYLGMLVERRLTAQ